MLVYTHIIIARFESLQPRCFAAQYRCRVCLGVFMGRVRPPSLSSGAPPLGGGTPPHPLFIFRVCLVCLCGSGGGGGGGSGGGSGSGSSMRQKCIMMCIKILDFTTIGVSVRILSYNLRGCVCVVVSLMVWCLGCVGNIRGCIV